MNFKGNVRPKSWREAALCGCGSLGKAHLAYYISHPRFWRTGRKSANQYNTAKSNAEEFLCLIKQNTIEKCGKMEVKVHALTSVLGGGDRLASSLDRFSPGAEPRPSRHATHRTEIWVGLTGDVEA